MKKIVLISFIALALFLGLNFLFSFSITKADTSDNITGWAWSENIGWVSFNCTNEGTCASSDYGVSVDQNGKFSGHAYSSNIGWVSFNENETGVPPSDDPCPDSSCMAKATPSGQLGKSNVNIQGWARVLAACDSIPCTSSGPGSNTGGWDGWLRFDHGQSDEVYIDTGYEFHGWAWGDMTGWLSFNSDEGGGEEYKVEMGPVCSCGDWGYSGCTNWPCTAACGVSSCSAGEAFGERICDPVGCDTEQSCFPLGICQHKECNQNNECIDVDGPGQDQCATDNDCAPSSWWDWNWWEIIPKQ